MESSKLSPKEFWDQHAEKLTSMASRTEMASSRINAKEFWDKHIEKLTSMASKTEMHPLRINAKEFWDQHIERLQSFDSEREATVDYLESVEEKRSSPRIRSLNLTTYIPQKDGQQDYIISIGRTLDVSAGGAKVETHRELERGTKLQLYVAIGDEIISAEGEVLHSKELGDGLFGIGIRFTSIKEQDRQLLRS